MFKRILATGLLAIITASAFAGKGHPVALSDTIDIRKKDSLQLKQVANLPADPKDGFKNLFIETDNVSYGVRIEKLNPMAIDFVEDYMEKNGEDMREMKDWGKPYFDVMESILNKYELPTELKYLAVVESRLKPAARSWAGAVGPWQFMAGTARGLGLKVGKHYDERRDLNKSTHAAARYLGSLYDIYGDWLLVIAAYNGGPGKVNSAIKKSRSRDFWVLQKYLPVESRNHVKKFIATHYIMEGEGGITTLTKNEAVALMENPRGNIALTDSNLVSQFISGRYHSSIVVKYIVMDVQTFNQMNPGFDKVVAEGARYELRLPKEKMDSFTSRKQDILAESLQFLLNPGYAGQTNTPAK